MYKMCEYQVILRIRTIMRTVVQYQCLLVLSYNWQGIVTSDCSAVEATVHDVMQMVLKYVVKSWCKNTQYNSLVHIKSSSFFLHMTKNIVTTLGYGNSDCICCF